MKIKKFAALCLALMLLCTPVFTLTACDEGVAPTGVLYLTSNKDELVVNGGSEVLLSAQMVSADDEISNRTITYEIVSGPGELISGTTKVRSKSTAQVGDKIKVQASAGDIKSNVIELTVVATPTVALQGLSITASATGVPGGTVPITVNKIPSDAQAPTIDLSIFEGETHAEISGTNVSIKATAPINTTIKVKATARDTEISTTHTIVVVAPTTAANIVVDDNHKADFADNSTWALSVKVFNLSTSQRDTTAEITAGSDNTDILETAIDGQTVELTVKGHGEATVTVTVVGTTASEEVTVNCLRAPEALLLPDYISTAIVDNSAYSIGLKNFEITKTNEKFTMTENTTYLRFRNGDVIPHFSDLYTYNFTANSKMPLPVEIVDDSDVAWSGDCDVDIVPKNSGTTYNKTTKMLEFSEVGKFKIEVKTVSGSKEEAKVSFEVNVIDGLSVETFEELRAVGMYFENVNENGSVRPITLNPTVNLDVHGVALVPKYLLSGNVYDSANGSGTFTNDDYRGMVNCGLNFFGNTTIIGNNATISLKGIPVLTGAETITVGGGPVLLSDTSDDSGEMAKTYRSVFSQLMMFFPSSGIVSSEPSGAVVKNIYAVNKDEIADKIVDDISPEDTVTLSDTNSTITQAMQDFVVDISNFSIVGNWGVNETGYAGTVWNRAIQINRSSIDHVNFDATPPAENNPSLKPYIFPQCKAQVNNISISNLSTGLRVNRLAEGSEINNFKGDNLYGAAMQIASSIVVVNDFTMGAVGGAGLELVPEDSYLAGNEKNYISSLGASTNGLVNQRVIISGEFILLEGSKNKLDTNAIKDFVATAGSMSGDNDITMTNLVLASLMNYFTTALTDLATIGGQLEASNQLTSNQVATAKSTLANLLAGSSAQTTLTAALVCQFGDVSFADQVPVVSGVHLIAFYMNNVEELYQSMLANASNQTVPITGYNKTEIAYHLDNAGTSSNAVASLQATYERILTNLIIFAGTEGDALTELTKPATLLGIVANSINTTNKYISLNFSAPLNISGSIVAFPVGELITYNPYFGLTQQEVVAKLLATFNLTPTQA